jgi:hypothetical protein
MNHESGEEVCREGEKRHTETKKSPYGHITGELYEEKVTLRASD